MIVLSQNAITALNRELYHYMGFRSPQEYGTSSLQYWYYQVRDEILSLDYDNGKYDVKQKYKMKYWGEIDFIRYRSKEGVYTRILNIKFNVTAIDNWVKKHQYPSSNTTKRSLDTPNVNSIVFVQPLRSITLPNGNVIYAVQTRNKFYTLADKEKNIVLRKWFNSLQIPLDYKIGNIHIVGKGSVNGVPFYIDDSLNLHHGAEIAMIQNPNKFESINRQQTIRLTEAQFKRILTECITKIINEIA